MISWMSLPTINKDTKINTTAAATTTTTATTTTPTPTTILESGINGPERLFIFEKNSPGTS